MSHVFDQIVAGGYFVSFGGLTAEQEQCKQFTKNNLDHILHIRQREKYVKEVRVCCCGYGTADEDEPMEDNNFSQFQFYLPFTNDLVYFHDKFDFLVKCVAQGVCKVEAGFEERYMQALLDVMTFRDTTVPEAPHHVLDLRTLTTPRTVGEMKRSFEENELLVDSYIKKRNTYSEKIRLELMQLEEEQFRCEKDRGEHKSVMGWSQPNTPTRAGEASMSSGDAASVGHEGDDAGVERIKTQIEMAREEAKLVEDEAAMQEARDQQLIDSYVQHGGSAPSADIGNPTPLLTMLLRLQEEQVRQEIQTQAEAGNDGDLAADAENNAEVDDDS